MSSDDRILPMLVDPAELPDLLDDPRIRVVDLAHEELHHEQHLPGAVHLPYAALVENRPPVGGLLPPVERLERTMSALGIGPDTHVVAMDAEGGGAAGRLLWTLEVLGHERVSLLDGGLRAWINEGHPVTAEPTPSPEPADFNASYSNEHVATAEYIMQRLGKPDIALLDARSADEYEGVNVRAARGGHIPGAVHYEWTTAMDRARNLRLRGEAVLREDLEALELTPDREIVVYCHTHHRSAFSYAMLRILGYERVRGYPGSWSDWGNREDTPVET